MFFISATANIIETVKSTTDLQQAQNQQTEMYFEKNYIAEVI